MLRYLFQVGEYWSIVTSSVVMSFSFLFYTVTPWVLIILWGNIEFFTFDYDSLPISFQSGITFFL